jgi:hypothetical protein
MNGTHQRLRSVVDVGRIDESTPTVDQEQSPCSGSIHDSADELRITRTPHQVRSDRYDRNPNPRIKDQLLGHRFGTGVVPAGARRIRRIRESSNQRLPNMRDRWARHINEGLHLGSHRRFENNPSSRHVDRFKVVPRSLDPNAGSQVDHRISTGHRRSHIAGVGYRT